MIFLPRNQRWLLSGKWPIISPNGALASRRSPGSCFGLARPAAALRRARVGRKLRQRQCVRQADGHGQRGLRLLAAVPEFQDRLARVHQRAGVHVLRPQRRLRRTGAEHRVRRDQPQRLRGGRRRQHHAAAAEVHQVVRAVRGHVDRGRLQPERPARRRVQGHRGRQQADRAACSATRCRPPASSSAAPTRTSTRRAATSSRCWNWPSPTATCRRTRWPRSWAPRTSARPPRRRSSPSPRWTRRCSPASSTRPAPSSPRRSSCTCAYIKLPDAINLGSVADAAAYKKATVTVKRRARPIEGLPAGHRHHHDRHAHPGRDRVRQVHAVPAGLAQYKPGGFTLLTPTVLRRQRRGTLGRQE